MTITDDYSFGTITAFIDNISCDIDSAELDKLEEDLYTLE